MLAAPHQLSTAIDVRQKAIAYVSALLVFSKSACCPTPTAQAFPIQVESNPGHTADYRHTRSMLNRATGVACALQRAPRAR
jgi:hypothetical protein